jgi:hypothetical protein
MTAASTFTWIFEGKTNEESVEFEEKVFAPSGAIVMGRRMLDLGIGPWGGNPTFHTPVFVVSNRPHDPIVKEGGTAYYFVTDGPEAVFGANVRSLRRKLGDRGGSIETVRGLGYRFGVRAGRKPTLGSEARHAAGKARAVPPGAGPVARVSPQLTAFFTSAPILFSSAAVNFFSA